MRKKRHACMFNNVCVWERGTRYMRIRSGASLTVHLKENVWRCRETISHTIRETIRIHAYMYICMIPYTLLIMRAGRLSMASFKTSITRNKSAHMKKREADERDLW
jgi:hypothetical protein